MFLPLKLLVLSTFLHEINAFYIGGFFEGLDQNEEMAFRVAVDMANSHLNSTNYFLTPLIANLEPEEIFDKHKTSIGITWNRPYKALKSSCEFLERGVVAMLAPVWEDNANTVQSVCDAKEIPFIRTTPEEKEEGECCSINLFPKVTVLARAYANLVQSFQWKNFTILYETHYSIAIINDILQLYNKSGHAVTMNYLHKNEYGNYRTILKSIRASGQKRFVLVCQTVNLEEILEQIQQVGLMRLGYNYVIVDPDLHTIDLTPYQYSETNITGLQFVDPTDPYVIKVAAAMQNKLKELGLKLSEESAEEKAWEIDMWTALIVDAVMLFAEALKDMQDFKVKPLFCNSTDSWEHGSTLFNFMKMKTIKGLTGLIHFDHQGLRSDITLNVVKLEEEGIVKTGTWTAERALAILGLPKQDETADEKDIMRNLSINVMIAWSEPYAFYKNRSFPLKGNDQYEGFVVDLIHEISLINGFNYTLIRNPDDKNGDYNETTKTWNGMIGDMLSGIGDIAIGDLTITRQRQEVVDFSTAFMTSGIQVLYKKPSSTTPAFFSFANPFAPKVWLLIAVFYVITSLTLYVMSRFCPSEWGNWDPCIQNPRYYFNQFNLKNAFWYVFGALVQEGTDISPSGTSTRILASFWAFFILVIVSYYKAQLAASLTVENYELPFTSIEKLVNNADELGIGYGAIENEAVHTFFKNSPIELHKKIAAYMDAHPDYMVYDNYDGYLLIEEQNYAFFTDSIFVEFATNAVCFLIAVGEPLNEQNFAIAIRKDLPYRAALSEAILRLLESGKVAELQKKWWNNEMFTFGECGDAESGSIAPPLNYYHVAGIFWITIGGIFLACILAFAELAAHTFKKCKGNYKEFVKDYKEELRFYFSFKNIAKPINKGRIVKRN